MSALRTAPLPRMAGDLTFMRAKRAMLDDLHVDSLAVIGIPFERNTIAASGCRFGPRALRETSVYFGWHVNAQFSHPVDIDARKQISTSSIHDRLVDLGDVTIARQSPSAANTVIQSAIGEIHARGASTIILGGDNSIVAPAATAHEGSLGLLQFGGTLPSAYGMETPLGQLLASKRLRPSNTVVVAPAWNPETNFADEFEAAGGWLLAAQKFKRLPTAELSGLARDLGRRVDSLLVHFDISVFSAALHGMTETPRFGGLTIRDMQPALTAIGQASVSSLMVTGLNPTKNGLSVVKVGQRLIMTALLGYIYGRLSLLSSLEREDT
ncbi:MAG: arginase family protein [Alphaproteobacteria bacterium]